MKTSILIFTFCCLTSFCFGSQYVAPQAPIEHSEGTIYHERPAQTNFGWGSTTDNSPVLPQPTAPGCIDPRYIHLQPDVDPEFINVPRQYYWTGGSRFGTGLYVKTLTGKQPKSLRDYAEGSISVFIVATAVRYVSGFGKMFRANCELQDRNTTIYCWVDKNPNTHDKGVDINEGIQNKKYYLVKTDNFSYLIFLTCVNHHSADYQLVTTRPYVTPNAVKEFVNVIKAANVFRLDEAIMMAPHIPPGFLNQYSPPFENYPYTLASSAAVCPNALY